MKKNLILCALLACTFTGLAQTKVERLTVGPYEVEYSGPGDFKYRLRDNINLYEFFELQKDTTIVAADIEMPVNHAIQISAYAGSAAKAPKEFGISGVWKQKINTCLYFNGGLSLAIGHTEYQLMNKQDMFEVGLPLQIELGKLNHQKAGLYGIFGLTPTVYTTMSAKSWNGSEYVDADESYKKSGFLIAPALEFGGNLPVGNTIMRLGVYGTYKINCTKGDHNIYEYPVGRFFIGAKIGVVI